MIKLNRSKENRIIIQKNINSKSQIDAFLLAIKSLKNNIDTKMLLEELKSIDVYKGRTTKGSTSTMGVRLSQICFYMFGYRDINSDAFVPSPLMEMMLREHSDYRTIALINLFSIQFPHPFSNTPPNFNIYFGRLLISLLMEEKLNKKLYIDEAVWFLPFVESIDEKSYHGLINSILCFRKLEFHEKAALFKSVPDYEGVFSNCMHEINYYLFNVFYEYDVFKIIGDEEHNEGNLLSFRHGKGNTFRTDRYSSKKTYSGYVSLNTDLLDKAETLLDNYKYYEVPVSQATASSRIDWIRDLYEFNPLKYLSTMNVIPESKTRISEIIHDVVYNSKFGGRDGKKFEISLANLFDNFREIVDVEIISGSGDTDILCNVEDSYKKRLYKINVDAKSTRKATSSLNASRLNKHIEKNGSDYCIVVSPKFMRGVKLDIEGSSIVTIEAESLANYCLKECINSPDDLADYEALDIIIRENFGKDISYEVNNRIVSKFGIV